MSIRSRSRALLLLLPILLALLAWPSLAQAEVVPLRSAACYATAPANAGSDAKAVAALTFSCAVPPATRYRGGWVWLRVPDVQAVRALPRHWHLITDQGRFDKVAMVARMRDGSVQAVTLDARDLKGNWAPGGVMRFLIDRPGAQVRDIQVGFLHLDDLSLMRKLSVGDARSALQLYARWLLLVGVFAGALLSAFAYNLLIYTGQRYAFQRIYLVWTVIVLAYGTIWSNALAFLVPGLVGPPAVRLDYILVGALIGIGNLFFLAVIEDGILPRLLKRITWVLAIATIAMAFIAAADWLFPATLVDRWMNYVVIAGASTTLVGIILAVQGRSRVVWFYLAGWAPVLCVFVLRVARNMGLLPQDDMVDMATFAALAFESVALSLAIADRFRLLRQERDDAAQAHDRAVLEGEALRMAAHTDYLTGLGNRAAFQAALQAMVQSAGDFALFLIDVDYLKDINDRLGHDGGDSLLAHVSGRVRMATGATGHVARIGGDEFALLVPGASTSAAVCAAGAVLEQMQGENWSHGGRAWSLSLSIGFARFPQDADMAGALYKNADLALYQAKRLGRRRRHDYDPTLRAGLDRRSAFIEDAYRGLERGEFALHYQPIVDMARRVVLGHEALLRWHHPVHGTMTPAVFGDVLSDRKLGPQLQDHVLTMALADLAAQGDRLIRVAINCTAAQLDGPHAAQRLLKRVEEAGIDPRRLCVEVTEDIVLGRTVEHMVQALELLSRAGIEIALDDFGTGYASLIHLKQLPFDLLKIDRSFVLSLFDGHGESEEIVRAIIGLGHGLRKQVVAEGIETEAQYRRLVELGCTLGQGYLFGRPTALALGVNEEGSASVAA